MSNKRMAKVFRETAETSVKVVFCLDGSGNGEITTGVRIFDHFLLQLSRHGVFDIEIAAGGSDAHHVVEDVAICLGRAFAQALGNKQGIVRMAHTIAPMDDALVMVAVDIGGRGYSSIEAAFSEPDIGDMPADLVRHFFETFAAEAKLNLHAKVLSGINSHHKAEALFKALAKTLDAAVQIDHRISAKVPSTKEIIDG